MTEEGEILYMDIYDNGFMSNEYKEKFKHLINNFYVEVEEKNHLEKQLEQAKEIIQNMLRDILNRMWYTDETIKQSEQFLNKNKSSIFPEIVLPEGWDYFKDGYIPV